MEKRFGFTLIELLITIVIIGVLATIGMQTFKGAQQRAFDAKRKADLDQVKKALRLYYNDYNKYPASNGSPNWQIQACTGTTACDADCSWGSQFVCNSMIYMNQLPQDPHGGTYKYKQLTSGTNFCLWTELENVNDPDIIGSHNRCTIGSSCAPNPIPIGTKKYWICAD